MTISPNGNSPQKTPPRKTLFRRLVPLGILIIGIIVARILAGGPPSPAAEPAPPQPAQQALYRLISPEQLPLVISAYGKLDTRRSIELAAETSGKIVATSDAYRVGNTVAANQVLLSLDDIDAKTELARAQARLAEAEEVLASERGRGQQAKREWRDLGSTEANALFLREPQAHRVELAAAAAKADLKLAQRNVERLQIRAPFNALINNISADLGDYVNKASVVATLLDTGTLEVHLPLSPNQFRNLNFSPEDFSQGIPIHLHREQDSLPATIRRAAAAVDSDTRLYSVIADIDPSTDTSDWRIGEFLRADIPGTSTVAMLAVPPEAIYEQRFLRIIDAQDQLHIMPIEISYSNAIAVYITARTATLNQPQRVIMSGLAVNTQGIALQPIPYTKTNVDANAVLEDGTEDPNVESAPAVSTISSAAEH
jgi:RND family efflux transporter MFP subunit